MRGPLLESIRDASHIFPSPVDGLRHFAGFRSGPRGQYIALTVKQLNAGMLLLNECCKGGGTVFPVGKSGGKAQRVVWHGTRVSEAVAKPPAPRHLADPSIFGLLDLEAGLTLRVTKRDCRTWFHLFAVGPSIVEYFARPPVSRRDLLEHGMTNDDLAACGAVAGCEHFFPCSRVWPMGFSWSSCVAQETLLSLCRDRGLTSDFVLAPDAPIPDSLALAFAVATDDLMVI